MRWLKLAAWVGVLLLAAFFWLQLQWARMVNDMTVYHLGRCSTALSGPQLQDPGEWEK